MKSFLWRKEFSVNTQLEFRSDGSVLVAGTVQHGDHRGRTLGVPTANVPLEDHKLADGVWAGWLIRADGTTHASAVSVGVRETFYGSSGVQLLEAHVLDFDGDLYGESITVILVQYLRGQRMFDSLDALIDQLQTDIDETRTWHATTRSDSHEGLSRVTNPVVID